jgi:flagellar protein FlbD
MIPLHRLTHPEHTLYLNPDLIQTVEANPDTVVALTNSSKLVVRESPQEVLALIRDWRAGILSRALDPDGPSSEAELARVVDLATRAGTAVRD